MRRIDLTLARDITFPFLAGLATLFVVLFSLYYIQGASVLVGAGVRGTDLVRVLAYLGPHFLAMGMPIALLLAVLVAIGRMSEDNEVIALSSAGVSPLRLLRVPLAFGVAVSLVGLFLSVFVVPNGRRGVRLLASELIKRNIAAEVQGGVFYEDLGDVVLYAERTNPAKGEWLNVFVHDDRERESPLILMAPHGKLDPGAEGENLHMRLDDGEVHRGAAAGDDYAVVRFDRADLAIQLYWSNFARGRFANTADEASIGELKRAAQDAVARNESPRAFLMQIWRRFADPLAAFVFAFIAVPVGIYRRRASRAFGLTVTALCGAGYYVLGRAGASAGDVLPAPVAANLGNFVIAAIAMALVLRVARVGAR